ncbi:MAG TPA: PKD domain-containing protein [Chitinophagaceae bacterium]|nr:PKD domain-containing protein [Chitinophagaceae bacterium]
MLKSNAQNGLCPSNLDFEQGDFTGWECRAGSTFNNPLPLTGPIPGRHTIITAATNSRDPFGNFPTLCPNGSGVSVMLGNHNVNREAESISYTYTIPSNLSTFSMLIFYAVVIESPGHTAANQPRFQARIIDLSTNAPLPCVNFDFIAQTTPGGFQTSPVPGNLNTQVLYKDWTPISINLNAYIGRDIMLEFITKDCSQGGHAGYAYVDVGTSCNGAITGNFVCPGNNGITLNAPFGFQNYTWYADNTYTTVLSTSQTLNVTPAPPAGTIYPVIVEPYPGFGCRDTLFANVQIAGNPVSNAGPDLTICASQQVQIGTTSTPGYSYLWTPATNVSSSIISNPFAWNPNPAPLEFVVKTTDIITGCFSYDTAYITGALIDTAMVLSGKTSYCTGDPLAGILSVSNTLVAVQWYDGTNPIPGATGFSYQPLATGNYWAQVQQNGCTDSTRTVSFTINPVPVANAGPDATICGNQQVQIGTVPNPAYNYSWTPAAQVSNPAIANPMAWVMNTTPQQFIVHTVDPATGCGSYDTTIITGRFADTSISATGKTVYCIGDTRAGSMAVSNTLTSVQWYNGNSPVPGATGFTFQPLTTGNYWAEVRQFGCTDSTRTISFTINPLPVVAFTPDKDSACITSNSFLFTNNSSISDGSVLSYLWKFSDGSTQTVKDASKSFLLPGPYTVKLITTSAAGCADSSAFTTVYVMPNGKANFSWDSVCLDRPVQFYNLSQENRSPLVNYNWTFNNGNPDVLVKDPPPVIYVTPGTIDVTLRLSALGCENYPDTISKKIQVNKGGRGIRYRDITVPQGAKRYINARDSVGNNFQWQPRVQLSNYSTRYTEFTATDDVLYKISITDIHTCVTVDTLQMLVLRKPGYYLPTAFTPNGDGLNDIVRPYLVGMKSLKSFSIFNRWGTLIFYSTKEGDGWDGKSKGVMQDGGVYVWMLEFYTNDNKLITEKGTITLIR